MPVLPHVAEQAIPYRRKCIHSIPELCGQAPRVMQHGCVGYVPCPFSYWTIGDRYASDDLSSGESVTQPYRAHVYS